MGNHVSPNPSSRGNIGLRATTAPEEPTTNTMT